MKIPTSTGQYECKKLAQWEGSGAVVTQTFNCPNWTDYDYIIAVFVNGSNLKKAVLYDHPTVGMNGCGLIYDWGNDGGTSRGVYRTLYFTDQSTITAKSTTGGNSYSYNQVDSIWGLKGDLGLFSP